MHFCVCVCSDAEIGERRRQQNRPAEPLPLHHVEHTDWQVAEGKDKQHHNQHASRFPPGSDLLDLSAHGDASHPHRLAWRRGLAAALERVPLPLHHRRAAWNLVLGFI